MPPCTKDTSSDFVISQQKSKNGVAPLELSHASSSVENIFYHTKTIYPDNYVLDRSTCDTKVEEIIDGKNRGHGSSNNDVKIVTEHEKTLGNENGAFKASLSGKQVKADIIIIGAGYLVLAKGL